MWTKVVEFGIGHALGHFDTGMDVETGDRCAGIFVVAAAADAMSELPPDAGIEGFCTVGCVGHGVDEIFVEGI